MTIKPLFLISTIVALAQPAVAAAEGRTLVFGNVSGWAVHTDPATNFACFAEARYGGESSLRVGFGADGSSLFLSIVDRAWAGAGAGDHVFGIRFDDQEPVSFTSPVIEGDGSVSVSIADEQQQGFLAEFANSYTISVQLDDGEPIMLSLGGSQNATRMLQDCRVSMQEYSQD